MTDRKVQLVLVLESQPDWVFQPKLLRQAQTDLNWIIEALDNLQVRKPGGDIRERPSSDCFRLLGHFFQCLTLALTGAERTL